MSHCTALSCVDSLCRQLFPSGGEATLYWKPPLCKKLPACATQCACDCRDGCGIKQNINDGERGGDLTLHTIAVLDNVNIVIINGIAKTDTVKCLCTANGNFSSQHVS
eukprot:6212188-Pleurochrysis_carterae.AAC.2